VAVDVGQPHSARPPDLPALSTVSAVRGGGAVRLCRRPAPQRRPRQGARRRRAEAGGEGGAEEDRQEGDGQEGDAEELRHENCQETGRETCRPSLEMTRARFEQLVAAALQTIPKRFRDEMQNVVVIVEREPSAEVLAEMEIPEGDTLYGLYQGTPLPERTW